MAATVRTRIVRIGNSQGVRIPKPLLEQSGVGSEVEIEAQDHQLVIRPAKAKRHPREGWEEEFRIMAERGEDRLPDWDVPTLNSWDEREWEW